MTEVYCRTCEEFTPLAVEDMLQQPHKLVCPQCYSILLTLKVDEEGIYTFQKVAALEVPRPWLKRKKWARPRTRRVHPVQKSPHLGLSRENHRLPSEGWQGAGLKSRFLSGARSC